MLSTPPSRFTKAPTSGPQGVADVRCQKCYKLGHYTYDCKNPAKYVARPTRTQQLLKGKKIADKPSFPTPAEFGGSGQAVTSSAPLQITEGLAAKILGDKEKEREKKKKRRA